MTPEFRRTTFFICMFSFIGYVNAQKGNNNNVGKPSNFSQSVLVSLRTRQDIYNDSLKQSLVAAKDDSTRFIVLSNLSYEYTWLNADTGLMYAQKQLLIAYKLHSERMEGIALKSNGLALAIMGNYVEALNFCLRAKKTGEKVGDKRLLFEIFLTTCIIYRDHGDYR